MLENLLNLSINRFEMICVCSVGNSQGEQSIHVFQRCERKKHCNCPEIILCIKISRLMLKLKLQYFGHLMQRVDSLEKTDAGRDWGQEEKGTTEDELAGWRHQLDGRESE